MLLSVRNKNRDPVYERWHLSFLTSVVCLEEYFLTRPRSIFFSLNVLIPRFSLWESQEAFQAARLAMIEAMKAIPFDEWEARPREFHTLHSLW